MKVTIYSAVFGGYDPEPYNVTSMHRENVVFRLYTDSIVPNGPGIPATFNGWEILNTIEEPFEGKDKFAKMNRYFKLNPQIAAPDSDINVYIDGNKQLFDIDKLLWYCQRLWNNNDIDAYFYNHEHRTTVQQEIKEIIQFRRDDPAKVKRQFKDYWDEGFRDEIPLCVASVQIRKTNAPALQEMLNFWYNEVLNKSYRDQISWPYAIWKTKFTRFKRLDVKTERFNMIANINHKKVLTI
jgi:hypothetical protein